MKDTCKGCFVMGTTMIDGVKTCEYCGLKVVPIKVKKEVPVKVKKVDENKVTETKKED